MTLFTKAENTSSHLKMGMMGFQGSGKTHTATSVAIGLVGLMRESQSPGGKPADRLHRHREGQRLGHSPRG
jgi:hypothetical protein